MVQEKYTSQVKLIVRQLNCGSVSNRNYGTQFTKGGVLFLIDDKTVFLGLNTVSEVLQEFGNPLVGAFSIPFLQDGKRHHDEPYTPAESFVRACYISCACAVCRTTFLVHGGTRSSSTMVWKKTIFAFVC
ncbi:MAG: hypothetical protein ACI8ZB_004588 [Desulforhopalus sp.]